MFAMPASVSANKWTVNITENHLAELAPGLLRDRRRPPVCAPRPQVIRAPLTNPPGSPADQSPGSPLASRPESPAAQPRGSLR